MRAIQVRRIHYASSYRAWKQTAANMLAPDGHLLFITIDNSDNTYEAPR